MMYNFLLITLMPCHFVVMDDPVLVFLREAQSLALCQY